MRVTINDNEQVDVSDNFEDNFYVVCTEVNDAAFKCNTCQRVSVHSGYEFASVGAMTDEPDKVRRIYGCAHCGKIIAK